MKLDNINVYLIYYNNTVLLFNHKKAVCSTLLASSLVMIDLKAFISRYLFFTWTSLGAAVISNDMQTIISIVSGKE